jgi:uncharacterized protein YdhG (YjbR/CyaY superfamily)
VETTRFQTIDDYYAAFPKDVKQLEELRKIIKEAAPNAQEVISYSMPAFKQNGILVYYAAGKNHIGLYPTFSPIVVFSEELKNYKTSKGAIQFPKDKPFPKALIKNIVKYRMDQDAEKARQKKAKQLFLNQCFFLG